MSTHINILRQQLIRHLILLKDVIINRRASKRAPEQESEKPVLVSSQLPHLIDMPVPFKLHLQICTVSLQG